jgi:hypothetical protein
VLVFFYVYVIVTISWWIVYCCTVQCSIGSRSIVFCPFCYLSLSVIIISFDMDRVSEIKSFIHSFRLIAHGLAVNIWICRIMFPCSITVLLCSRWVVLLPVGLCLINNVELRSTLNHHSSCKFWPKLLHREGRIYRLVGALRQTLWWGLSWSFLAAAPASSVLSEEPIEYFL